MKIRFLLFIAGLLLLQSCSKKSNISPDGPNTVTMNGTVYPTVTINGQTWTAQNYRGPGGSEIVATGSDAALTGNYYNTLDIDLPTGWRVPSVADFNKLFSGLVIKKDGNGNEQVSPASTDALKSTNGWKTSPGTNSTGFNAYPAGILVSVNSTVTTANLVHNGLGVIYLSTTMTEVNSSNVYALSIDSVQGYDNGFPFNANFTSVALNAQNFPVYCSVRFVKDN